jgi:hypothetical protein
VSEHRYRARAAVWLFGHLPAIQDHVRSFRRLHSSAVCAMEPTCDSRPGATPRSAQISGSCDHHICGEHQIREENSGATLGEFTPPGLGHEAHDAAEPWVRYELARATPFQ